MLTYTCELHTHGLLKRKFVSAAFPAALIGDLHEGRIYAPSLIILAPNLPFRLRKAALRAQIWHDGATFSIPLYSLRGKPLGTIFCTRDWR